MRDGKGLAANPVPWATVIMLLLTYAGLVVFALRTGRAITLADIMMFLPTHMILAVNVLGILGLWRGRDR